MKNVPFFIRQALSNMNRNRQRTLFVLFCIAVGVAVVVSLRTLGFMIEDTLTGNLQAENRSDIFVAPANAVTALASANEVDESLINEGSTFGAPATFSDEGIERIQQWADERGYATILTVRQQSFIQLNPVSGGAPGEFATIYVVESEAYPFYRPIEVIEPDNLTFAEALADDNSVVLTEQLADQLEVSVGDGIELTGTQEFIVTAIVDDGSEATLTDFNTLLVPYAYVDYEIGTELFVTQADSIYIQLPPDSDVAAVAAEFEETFVGLALRTTEDLREFNSVVSEAVTQLITVMGLLSLLIGGIGIVNTMVVIVGRRTREIAVLKTIGLQGRQITLMFIIEALVMGIFGSLLGLILGVGLVFILQRAAEELFAQGLNFGIFPQALLFGLVLGVIVTLVFGLLPTISAGQVRPAVVLSPNGNILPRAGRIISFLIVILMTAILGVLVGIIMENMLLGMGVAYGALASLAIAIGLFWFLIIVLSRLPSFGSIRLKLAQRAMGAKAIRTASTLLALVVGIGALSVILFMTNSLVNVVDEFSTTLLGGNVLVQTQAVGAAETVDETLAELAGVINVDKTLIYSAEIVAINDERDLEGLRETAITRGREEMGISDEGIEVDNEFLGNLVGDFDPALFQINLLLDTSTLQVKDSVPMDYEIGSGSDISVDGTQQVVLQENVAFAWLGIGLGDSLTFAFNDGAETTVTIAGFIAAPETDSGIQVNSGPSATVIVTEDGIPAGVQADPPSYIVDVEEAHVDEAITALSDIPGVFAFDGRQITALFERLIDQFTALPLVIAVLALFASAVIIANTVSLATLERKREIGIMKAIGMQSNSVLSLLLLENGLIGLLGGVIGTSISAAAIAATALLTENLSAFPFVTLFLLILLAVGLALGATLLAATGAVREKPLIVLRYE